MSRSGASMRLASGDGFVFAPIHVIQAEILP
jgi:hypothetical protein